MGILWRLFIMILFIMINILSINWVNANSGSGADDKNVEEKTTIQYIYDIEQEFNKAIEDVASKNDPIGLKKIITDKQEVIGNFSMLWRTRNIYSIPWWKYNLMKKKWFEDIKILHYHIINTLECWDEQWNCDSWADSWPFQINQVHRGDYKKSMELLKAWKWIELYEYQLDWTENSMEDFKKRLCKKDTEDLTFKCMLRNHNWNVAITKYGTQFRDEYSKAGLNIKYIVLDIIKKK